LKRPVSLGEIADAAQKMVSKKRPD
jgi:hypothetical protein